MDAVPTELVGATEPKLIYYNARGTVLKCRLLLADMGIKYQWTPLDKAEEEVISAKISAPSCTLPIWEDSVTKVSGSAVILEYLGANLGKYSASLQVQAAARALVLYCESLLDSIWKEAEVVAAFLATDPDMTRSESISTYRQNRILPGLTILTRDMLSLKSLSAEPLYSDYALLEVLYYANAEYPELVDQFPPLRELFQRYVARPGIRKLIDSLV